ncbi:MAG: putative secreted acid phosphatase [Acidobacteria bacterium OLB17]|nr:MAG: putative secreted acid phosphatase [Acidobacteria bacterium OLB17]MCZ2390010.1 5'-nucleotidase, lipoprotein e(P4) family [Acidobacteriota bacterium]
MKLKFLALALTFAAVASGATYLATGSSAQKAAPSVDNSYQIGAVLYMQKAGEYRALCYQAFNIARLRLDADFNKKNLKHLTKAERKMPRAIMVDIDETVLDNSPAQAYGIRNNKAFNLADWYAWGEMRKAKAIPGAVDFLNYAHSRGVKIFYVSNRDEVQKAATMENLKKVGFNDITDENVMLRQKESSKEARRDIIRKKYRIVMQFGDNLDDLSNAFEKKSVEDRFAEVDKARLRFGTDYIVLPNAMYGTWESAIYGYERLTDEQKAERRQNALEMP